MKRDLRTAIDDIGKAQGPALLLLFGDDFRVQEFCHTLIDLIVPKEQRCFNLERFDGRSVAWDRIEASLATPPFLPGRKVVWVENAPFFLSREQRSELADRVLQLWIEGKKEAAGKLFMQLLSLEGWNNEQWENVDTRSRGALSALFGSEAREQLEPLIAFCKSQGLDLAAAGLEGDGLSKLMDRGLPPWSFLLLTASQVDRRSRLYKRLDEIGAALYLGLERDSSGRVDREVLLQFIQQRLGEGGKTIGGREREMILLRTGSDLRALQQELEKLLLYIGDRPAIRTEDVQAILTDQGEGWIFDLTHAIADRDAVAALSHLSRLLAQGEHPLKLLGTLASEIRKLLAARQLIEGELKDRWSAGMTYQQFQQTVLRDTKPILMRHPYADYMCFQRAEKFSLAGLRFCLAQIYDTDLRLKTTGNQPRLLMERLIVDICLATRPDKYRVEHRMRP
jgi:DNA polymerase-3 subunit delta